MALWTCRRILSGLGFCLFAALSGDSASAASADARVQDSPSPSFQEYLRSAELFAAEHPGCVIGERYVSSKKPARCVGEKVRSRSSIARLVRGDPAVKEIALTIDDGPVTGYTERLLEILAQEKVRATFFLIGRKVVGNPSLVRQAAQAGHELANITFSHIRLPTLPDETIDDEISKGALAIQWAAPDAPAPRYFRPPGGEYNSEVINLVNRYGFTMALWTVSPADYANPGASVIESRVLRQIRNGGIILLHDGVQQTLDMLPGLIHKLKGRGYRFVTVSEMAGRPGAIRHGGPNTYIGQRSARQAE